MISIEHLKSVISRQLQLNEKKNLFSTSAVSLHFTKEMNEVLAELQCHYPITALQQEELLTFLVVSFEHQLYNTNQYIHFQADDLHNIRSIYLQFLHDLISKKLPLKQIEANHYQRIKQFIKTTNPSIALVNTNSQYYAKQPVCSEYSALFQMQLLNLDITALKEPILDIGCGEHGYLVKYLRSFGKEAYGIDRMPLSLPFLQKANWLEFPYQTKKWGTILSNLAFSSHCIAHQQDAIAASYITTYKAILDALQDEGSFIYAPALPLIESYLPASTYSVIHHYLQEQFYATRIIKHRKRKEGLPN